MEDVLCLDVALLVDDRVYDHTRLGLVGGDDVLDLVNIIMISIQRVRKKLLRVCKPYLWHFLFDFDDLGL